MIVVVGDIAVDIVSTLKRPLTRGSDAPAEIRLMPGGSGANVAIWLARLGQRVTFIGRIGDDMFGRWLHDNLVAEGVAPALIVDHERRTGVIQVLVEPDGERTMAPDRGANAAWAPEEISEALIAGANLLHVVGYVLLDHESQPGALTAMAYARKHGIPISLDPSSHAPLLSLGASNFWGLVGKVDLLLPNRQEARALSDCREPADALLALRRHADAIVIKLDREGCITLQGSGVERTPAPVVPVVNATGAGDAFNAAFLAAWRLSGDLRAACRAAVSLGAFAATLPSSC
jgi:sugar/nucleoside kinase (ribokinase family)